MNGSGAQEAGKVTAARRYAALRWMVSGFLLSFLGSALIEGGAPGLVSIGVLPVLWLTVLRTVEYSLGLLSPLTMRVLERCDPSRILLGVEGCDIVLSSVALILISVVGVDVVPIVIAYFLIAAVLPPVIDIAEELYAAQMVRGDERAAVRLNSVVAAGSGVVAAIIGRPLGAWTSTFSLTLLLVANVAFSALALLARWRAVRLVPTGPTVVPGSERRGVALGRSLLWTRVRAWSVRMAALGVLSPFATGAVSFVVSLVGTYLALWLVNAGDGSGALLGVAMAVTGIGRVIGPVAADRLSRRVDPAKVAALSAAGSAISLVAITLTALVAPSPLGTLGIVLLLVALFVFGAATVAVLALIAALRQARLHGRELSRTIAAAHACFAAASILGFWIGLALDVIHDPVPGLLLCAGVTTALAALLVRSTRRPWQTAP